MKIFGFVIIGIIIGLIIYDKTGKKYIKKRLIKRLDDLAKDVKTEAEYAMFCKKYSEIVVYLVPQVRSQFTNEKFGVLTKQDLKTKDVYLTIKDINRLGKNQLLYILTVFRRVYFKSNFTTDVMLVVGFLTMNDVNKILQAKNIGDLVVLIKANFDPSYLYVNKKNSLVSGFKVESVSIDCGLIDNPESFLKQSYKTIKLQNVSKLIDLDVSVDTLVIESIIDLNFVSKLIKSTNKLIVINPLFDSLDLSLVKGVKSVELYKTKFKNIINYQKVDPKLRLVLNGAFLNEALVNSLVNYFELGNFSNLYESKTTGLRIDDQIVVEDVKYMITGLHVVFEDHTYDYGCRIVDQSDANIYLFNHRDVTSSLRRVASKVKFNESIYDDFAHHFVSGRRKVKRATRASVMPNTIKLSPKFFDIGLDENTKVVINFYSMCILDKNESFCYNGISSINDQFKAFLQIEYAFINKILKADLTELEISVILEKFYMSVSHYSFTKIRMLFFFSNVKRMFWIDEKFNLMIKDCALSVKEKCQAVLRAYQFYFNLIDSSSEIFNVMIDGEIIQVKAALDVITSNDNRVVEKEKITKIIF